MASFVETTVQEIDSRLKELHDEITRLTAAREALVGPGKRGPGRPPGSSTASRPAASAAAPTRRRAARTGRTGRTRGRRGGNTRANQALELVRSSPGITIPQNRRGAEHRAELPVSRDAEARLGGIDHTRRPRLPPRRHGDTRAGGQRSE